MDDRQGQEEGAPGVREAAVRPRFGVTLASILSILAVVMFVGRATVWAEDPPADGTVPAQHSQTQGLVRSPAQSLSNQWTVFGVTGEALEWRRGGGAWQRLSAGTVLGPDTELSVGADSRALLARGENGITVTANSRMALPPAPAGSAFTRILQSLGTVLFRVEKRPGRHFQVETPYLVATVKGTTFSVSVSDVAASVSVDEGAVEVSESDGDQTVEVTPGQTASVAAEPGSGIQVGPSDRGATQAPNRSQQTVPGTGQGKGGKAGGAQGSTEASAQSGAPGNGNAGGNGGGNAGGQGGGKP